MKHLLDRQTVALLVLNACVASVSMLPHWVLLEVPGGLPAAGSNVSAAAEASVVVVETMPRALEQTLLFSPSRTRLASVPAEPVASPSATLPRLVGVMTNGHEPSALLEAESTALRRVVAEGDLFDGWIVVTIAGNAIQLQAQSSNGDGSHVPPSVEIRLRQPIQPSQDRKQ